MGCSKFGTRPNKQAKQKFESSSQFNKEIGAFENRKQEIIKEMKARNMSWGTIKEWFSSGNDRVPNVKLPEITPDLNEFLKASDELKVIWFGHSSFLLNMDGIIILVDPVFGKSAAPFNFMVKRFQAPVLELEELPKIDFILISHDHYDHLDMPTVQHFQKLETKFITPLGVGSHLTGWGIERSRIIEKDWWESAVFENVEFTATPAQHFSGRNGIYDNETLWASWVIKSPNHKVYFSGDSGYDSHFKEIGDKLGPFDVAFIENGQYDKRWREVHMLPEEAVVAFKELRAKKYFPVHWGMFELSFHPWYDPIETIHSLSRENDIELVAPKIGELVDLKKTYELNPWWSPLYKK